MIETILNARGCGTTLLLIIAAAGMIVLAIAMMEAGGLP